MDVDESISMGSSTNQLLEEFLSGDTSDDGLDDIDEERSATGAQDKEAEKPMIGAKIDNTNRWKIIVLVIMCVNTALVISATILFLRHEENKVFENAVSWSYLFCVIGS